MTGLSVRADVELGNVGREPLAVSNRLNLMEGDLWLEVAAPDGQPRLVPGWQADTARRDVELHPGHRVQTSLNIFWTEAGLTFPEPGLYRLRFRYDPSVRMESVWSDPVDVKAIAPRSKADQERAAHLADDKVRRALVLAQADGGGEAFAALARHHPTTLDGRLAALLVADLKRTDLPADILRDDPVTAASLIAMLMTPYSRTGTRLADRYLKAADLPDDEATHKAEAILRGLPMPFMEDGGGA